MILAGGFGTRISEESSVRPKPMVEIGNKPILWHIMKTYSTYNINEFIICCGYKGYMIKEYFANYFMHMSDVSFDMRDNKMDVLHNGVEPWKVTLIDTGGSTMTGGRIKRVMHQLGKGTFCLTYGDGVTDVNINELISFHKKQNGLATLTAVQPPGRFGAFNLGQNEYAINSFKEKPHGDGAWINGGYFVLEPETLDYIDGDDTVWEKGPLEKLAQEGELSAFKHKGFWQPMDTLRDKQYIEELWDGGNAPWKVWK